MPGEYGRRSGPTFFACRAPAGNREIKPASPKIHLLFLYMYVRKEAVLSSMIEGIQSSLSDLLLFELNVERPSPLPFPISLVVKNGANWI
jgi:hypothetical protein